MTSHKITTVTLDPVANENISNEIPKLITSEKSQIQIWTQNVSNKFQKLTVENNVSNDSTFLPIDKNINNHVVFPNSSKSHEKSSVTGLPHIDDVPSRNESLKDIARCVFRRVRNEERK
ncbi:hypothetical protein EPUL_006240, partial [Erysiphe pulchra]